MRLLLALPILCLITRAPGDELQTNQFNTEGSPTIAGWPKDHTPVILAIAEKPLRLSFDGQPAKIPTAQLHRITAARKLSLDAPTTESAVSGWQWTWTPPKTRGPAQYAVRFDGEPTRIVRIESRDPEWLKATLELLAAADWNSEGLTREELTALTHHGLRLMVSHSLRFEKTTANGANESAFIQMIPKQGDASRRRVVWDKENPTLVVWRPGPASGDWEIRAPRWWISPAALATDHGLIRFLDLFSEPPLKP